MFLPVQNKSLQLFITYQQHALYKHKIHQNLLGSCISVIINFVVRHLFCSLIHSVSPASIFGFSSTKNSSPTTHFHGVFSLGDIDSIFIFSFSSSTQYISKCLPESLNNKNFVYIKGEE